MYYFYILLANVCFNNAVGVAEPGIIPDNQMKASSYYYNSYRERNYSAYYGRLNETRGGSWCTQRCCASHDWLQVDLGKSTEICGVATQGNGDDIYNSWVTDFKLSFSSDGSGWTAYSDGSEVVRIDLYT